MTLPVIVPSWVIPGSPAANAVFLRGRARGIMLCAFEYAPRLPVELPASPLDLRWHVHLPLDLPWEREGPMAGMAAGRAACRVMAEAAHLLDASSRAVLHRPPGPSFLAGFLRAWGEAGWDSRMLLLENGPDDPDGPDDDDADDAPDAEPGGSGLRLCLDAAHLALSLPAPQAAERAAALAGRVEMIHWSAPYHDQDAHESDSARIQGDPGGAAPRPQQDAHAPLSALDAGRKKLYRQIAESMPEALDVIEVFDWDGVLASWEALRGWRGAGGSDA